MRPPHPAYGGYWPPEGQHRWPGYPAGHGAGAAGPEQTDFLEQGGSLSDAASETGAGLLPTQEDRDIQEALNHMCIHKWAVLTRLVHCIFVYLLL